MIIVSDGKLIFYLGEPSSGNLPSNNGTSCCSFLALKISEKWHLEIKSIGSDRKRFVDIVEDTQHFPKRVNHFHGIWRHYDLLEAADILSENNLLENTTHLKESSKVTRVFSNDGREDLFNALSNISSIEVLVCPPYIFVVCRLANEYVIIDTHAIKSQLGGNDNGIVIAFPNIENCLSWIIQRLNLSGVKGSDWQKLYEVSFPTKKDVPIFDEGDLSNDGNSPSICSNFRSISRKEEQ